MQRIIKIGTNRGKARIWLEGKCLEALGWQRGIRFHAEFSKGKIRYIRCEAGKRKVAGSDKRPVIDTNTDKIKESVGDFKYVVIHVTRDVVEIVGTEITPESKMAKAMKGVALLSAVIAAPFLMKFKPDAKKILVGCEESGRVRRAFQEKGHDVVSCDLLDTSDPFGWHIKDDVLKYIDGDWDRLVGFPDCTFLTNSAAWAFNDPNFAKYPGVGYHQRVKEGTLVGEKRRRAQQEAFEFFLALYNSKIPEVALENPVGALSRLFRKPDQIIQPYEFGDPESKSTCLWLKNLPALVPTNILHIEEAGYLATNGKWRWMNQTGSGQSNLPPTKDRDRLRSRTYPGIAKAMADQWI